MEAPPVPRFASFKPKSDKKPAADNATPLDHGHRRHHHRRRQRSREQDSPAKKSPPAMSEPTHTSIDSESFFTDRRGDAKNVEYASIHRYDIAAYHRSGYGNVIGGSRSIKINRDESTDKEVVLTSTRHPAHHGTPRFLTAKHGKVQTQHLRFVAAGPDGRDDIDASGYIELRPSRKRKRDVGPVVDDIGHVDYRSIEGKAKLPVEPADQDLVVESDSDADDLDEVLGLQSRKTNAALLRQARAMPGDIEPWLSLVEHQVNLIRPGTDIGQLTSSERRTLADLRLSVLNEAATHITEGKPQRERILQALLEEGAVIWDHQKLLAKWKHALSECPISILLWTRYLDYLQDSHVSFRYDACKAAYVSCLQILSKHHEEASSDRKMELYEVQVFIFVRLTCFIRDAGYGELATALWQAVLEFHFLMPGPLLSDTFETQILSLGDFWNSETARIGEDDARAWTSFAEEGTTIPRLPILVKFRSTVEDPSPLNFASEEARLAQISTLPVSADDEAAIADPYGYIMFSDIRDMLEPMCHSSSKEALVTGFLHFFGLPSMSVESPRLSSAKFTHDLHLCVARIYEPESDISREQTPESEHASQRVETTDTLFDDAFDAFRRRTRTVENQKQLVQFLDRVLRTLCGVRPNDEYLAEYLIAFELHMLPDHAPKTARRLLKQRPSSLRLYNAYALVLARTDRLATAIGVWSTALGMTQSLSTEVQHCDVSLWQSRLLIQVHKHEDDAALLTLLTIGSKGDVDVDLAAPQIRQLQTLRLLEDGYDRMRLLKMPILAVAYANIMAWLAYLTTGYEVPATLKIYQKYEESLAKDSNPVALELLHQFKASLLQVHIERRRSYKPAMLRKNIRDSLDLFPNNSVLMDLHAILVTQDRLRILMQEQKLSMKPTSVGQWSHKIAEEIDRAGGNFAGSTPHSIRSTFVGALLAPESRVSHSPALWLMWLRFEYQLAMGRKEPLHRVKQVFLDGLRYLPWYKHWAIQGLRYLEGSRLRSDSEVRQVYNTMSERGLRLRVEL